MSTSALMDLAETYLSYSEVCSRLHILQTHISLGRKSSRDKNAQCKLGMRVSSGILDYTEILKKAIS